MSSQVSPDTMERVQVQSNTGLSRKEGKTNDEEKPEKVVGKSKDPDGSFREMVRHRKKIHHQQISD